MAEHWQQLCWRGAFRKRDKIIMSSNTTLKQKAYSIIQNKLLQGELRAGDLVSELTLAEEIGMSRTPVREAIGQLEIEGLFDKVPRTGTIVRLPDQSELRELYEVREALESHAAAIAANVLDAADIAEMERLQSEVEALGKELETRDLLVLDEPLLHRFFQADIGFHDLIGRATRNRRTLKIINEFRVVQRVFEYDRMDYDAEIVQATAREHGAVLRALSSGDGDGARLALAAHIRASRNHAMDSFIARARAQDGAAEAPARPKYRARLRNARENAETLASV